MPVAIEGGVATLTLNRPEVHNAFDDALIARLTDALSDVGADADVRVVVLAGRGKSFCAGADLAHMKKAAGFSEAENIADAQALARLLMVLGGMPKPTVALVQGPAYGGGVGLVSACDIAIAAERASFALTEVRLGLIPAVISPFVVRAIGESQSRRFMLTGERFSAETALRIGLVHEVVPADGLEARGAEVARMLLAVLAGRASPRQGADRRGCRPAHRRHAGRRCRAPHRRGPRLRRRQGRHRRLPREEAADVARLNRTVRWRSIS